MIYTVFKFVMHIVRVFFSFFFLCSHPKTWDITWYFSVFLSLFVFQITPDSQNDFGSYNCTATNVMGSESKEFLLIQAGLLTRNYSHLGEIFSVLGKQKKHSK